MEGDHLAYLVAEERPGCGVSGRFASKVRDRTQSGHGPECAALFIGRAVRRTTCQLKGFMMQS